MDIPEVETCGHFRDVWIEGLQTKDQRSTRMPAPGKYINHVHLLLQEKDIRRLLNAQRFMEDLWAGWIVVCLQRKAKEVYKVFGVLLHEQWEDQQISDGVYRDKILGLFRELHSVSSEELELK